MIREEESASPRSVESAGEDQIELLLDDALAATFPASDPVGLSLGADPRVVGCTATREEP